MTKQYAKDQPQGYKNHIQNIAVVGVRQSLSYLQNQLTNTLQAGGQSGKFIVEELLKNGTQKITALTREDSSNKIPDGVIRKFINYEDQASLVAALQGQDALVITMGVLAPPGQSAKLIQAAADANVPWIVPNEFGGDGTDDELNKATIIGVPKKKDRELIESLGKSSWLGIACSFWYEFSLAGGEERYGFNIKEKTVQFYDDGEQKIDTSTWSQSGRGVANLLGLKILPEDENDTSLTLDSYRNKFIHVSSFHVNQKDMLASILRVTGDSIENWKTTSVPVEQYYEENLAKLKTGDRVAFARTLYSRMFFKDAPADFTGKFGLDNDKLGLPKEDLDEYTKIAVNMDREGYFDQAAKQYEETLSRNKQSK